MRRIFFLFYHPLLELRNKLGDWIVETHFAFVGQHHDRSSGEHLCHRSNPEYVAFADWLLRLDIGEADYIPVVNLPDFVRDDADKPRKLVAVEIRLHCSRDLRTCGRVALSSKGACGKGDRQQG